MSPNRNLVWARAVAQELQRSGVRDVCLSPGSRSAPLALAVHAEPGLRVTTHLDERAAAFFAVGVARASGRPVAVLTTSGTAVANLLPAAIEAHYALVPLVLLTADRPPELHDVGANQSIDQTGIFERHARLVADVGVPEMTSARLRHVRALVDRAVASARGPPAGPVHLNLPFREPLDARMVPGDIPSDLASDASAVDGRPDRRPFVDVGIGPRAPPGGTLDELAAKLESAERPLLICGPRTPPDGFAAALLGLARAADAPVLADALSGVRFGAPPDVPVLSAYDAFLTHTSLRDHLRPDLILRFGASPTSKSLLQYLGECTDVDQILVDETGRFNEETAGAGHIVAADPTLVCQGLTERIAPATRTRPWTTLLRGVEATTWDVLEAGLGRRPFEGALAAAIVRNLPTGATLFVSNSLPIRDVDRFARGTPKPLRVLANRGASGIDGIASSALGAALALGGTTFLLIGDLAFLHDLNGFVAARRLGLDLRTWLVHNDGGGIFGFLPVSAHEPPFTELFTTPHGLDLAAVAGALGIAVHRVELSGTTDTRIRETIAAQGASVTEVASDRKGNVEHRRALEAEVGAALDRLLEETPRAH